MGGFALVARGNGFSGARQEMPVLCFARIPVSAILEGLFPLPRPRDQFGLRRDTMLLELRAENYAVIDHAIAVFGPGLNLLTGETGAGKSILVDALALLMGGKSSTEVVRHGADKAVVSCVFEATPGAEATLEENGIDSEGNEIILRREILSSGKGRVFVNNQPATVAVLKA